MAFYPPPPNFELHPPLEPQWFPRPITDTIESSLDILERLEEDRRRRLRHIANVPARMPIGLGGTEDQHARKNNNSTAANSSVSPKPNHNSARASNYGRYRYYPPPEITSTEDTLSLHRSYAAANASTNSPLVTGRSRERKNHQQRRGGSAGNIHHRSRSTSRSPTSHPQRRDLHTPTDGIGTVHATATTAIHRDDYSSSPSSSIEGGRFLNSFHHSSSSALMLFTSPPLDPRAGGGGRRMSGAAATTPGRSNHSMRSPWMMHPQPQQSLSSSSVDWSDILMSTPHLNHALHQQQQRRHPHHPGDTTMISSSSFAANYNDDDNEATMTMMMDETDLITPPAMTTTTSTVNDHGGDGSVRRSQRQRRRRRRDWE